LRAKGSMYPAGSLLPLPPPLPRAQAKTHEVICAAQFEAFLVHTRQPGPSSVLLPVKSSNRRVVDERGHACRQPDRSTHVTVSPIELPEGTSSVSQPPSLCLPPPHECLRDANTHTATYPSNRPKNLLASPVQPSPNASGMVVAASRDFGKCCRNTAAFRFLVHHARHPSKQGYKKRNNTTTQQKRLSHSLSAEQD